MKQNQTADKKGPHFKECTELSKNFKAKYEPHGDCGVTDALSKLPLTDRAETAIYDSMNILPCIVKAYSEEPSLKERLDKELAKNNIFSRRVR